MECVSELSQDVGIARASDVLGVSRASFYRWGDPPVKERKERPSPPRALRPQEHQAVLETLNSAEFCDQAPAEVYATLLDRQIYLCSIRTMYRILDDNSQVRERRDQLRHPAYKKPELLATGPNQVWSWDITKLLGPAKWTYYYLYVIIDIFSRYVVGWMVAEGESAALAKKLIEETVTKERIHPEELVIHSDRGPSMTSKPVALLLADLGVTKSHSRPYVSNDNPYSEAQFKTLKYRPEFPERFGSVQDARSTCRALFQWYNTEHRHLGIALLTPEAVHHGRAEEILLARQEVLEAAYAANPERFVGGLPVVAKLPEAVWINPPSQGRGGEPSGANTVPENDAPGSPINDDLGSTRPKPPLKTDRPSGTPSSPEDEQRDVIPSPENLSVSIAGGNAAAMPGDPAAGGLGRIVPAPALATNFRPPSLGKGAAQAQPKSGGP